MLRRLIYLLVALALAPAMLKANRATSAQNANAPVQSTTTSPAPNPSQPKAVTMLPDSKKLEIVRIIRAVYPSAAEKRKLNGKVVVRIQISETGDVTTAEVVSGEALLAPAALDAAKGWKFSPYIKDGVAVPVAMNLPFEFEYRDKPPDETFQSADKNTKPLIDGLFTVRISADTAQKMLIQRTNPIYPALARGDRVQGAVVMFVIISKQGEVQDLRVLSGHPLLVPASVSAVKQWRFRPYVLAGEAIEVQTTITVNFTLGGG